MRQTIDILQRIFTLYFLIVSFVSGFIAYIGVYRKLKDDYPAEANIAKYTGLFYMIGGVILYIGVQLFT